MCIKSQIQSEIKRLNAVKSEILEDYGVDKPEQLPQDGEGEMSYMLASMDIDCLNSFLVKIEEVETDFAGFKTGQLV